MIFVIADISVAKGRRQDLLNEFEKLVPLVHAEDGCIEYTPVVDQATELPILQPPREDVVTVVEKWESVAALQAHLDAPHMLEYREAVKDIVTDVSIRVMATAGDKSE